jgi:hypothetical protein
MCSLELCAWNNVYWNVGSSDALQLSVKEIVYGTLSQEKGFLEPFAWKSA